MIGVDTFRHCESANSAELSSNVNDVRLISGNTNNQQRKKTHKKH
jgi:hypothetical protein